MDLPVRFKNPAYADDILIGASSVKNLEEDHAVVDEFCQAAGVRLNSENIYCFFGPVKYLHSLRISHTGFGNHIY